jgi:hypothetical protein
MNPTTTALLLTAVAAMLTAVLRTKALETYFDERMKSWLSARNGRQLARRVSAAELRLILENSHEDLETVCLLLQAEYACARITVIEFTPQPGQVPLATCLVEARVPGMASVKHLFQRVPVQAAIWATIQQFHDSPSRCLYVPDARLLDNPPYRMSMLKTGARSAYYQALPDAPGQCRALMSISWQEPTAYGPDKLDALHLSARLLGAVLRSIWPWRTPDVG